MSRSFGVSIAPLSVALMCGFASPAIADGAAAARAFVRLCAEDGYRKGGYSPSANFPDAFRIPKDQALSDAQAALPFEVVDAWDLSVAANGREGMALVIGLLQHPSLGEMAACMILTEMATTGALEDGIIAAGAEREGEYLILDGATHPWMIKVTGWPDSLGGEAVIMGMTSNGSPP